MYIFISIVNALNSQCIFAPVQTLSSKYAKKWNRGALRNRCLYLRGGLGFSAVDQ